MTRINSAEITDRIDDWVSRLQGLYDMVDEWMQTIPHDKVERGVLRQAVEPLMRQFDIRPRDLPTYTILQGSKRIEFVPSALWVVGANGRVNVTTGQKQYVLVDRAEWGHGSKWQLVVDDFSRLLVPFNKAQLLRLMTET